MLQYAPKPYILIIKAPILASPSRNILHASSSGFEIHRPWFSEFRLRELMCYDSRHGGLQNSMVSLHIQVMIYIASYIAS